MNERKPDFNNLLKVLKHQQPDRPTLFEFFLNESLYNDLAGYTLEPGADVVERCKHQMAAYINAGYDYVTVQGSNFAFPSKRHQKEGEKSISINEGGMINDRASFEAYPWPDPMSFDYSRLDKLSEVMPEGLKLIVWGPGGVLENVITIVGYENLCYMLADDPKLVKDIFNAVGSRFVAYYRICASYDSVGAIISNDDWGYKSQPMLSIDNMRELVIPWHKKIVEQAHNAGKPAILHSCGQLENLMDDIIDVIGFDGKHSYEDNILPVEQAYERWGHRIAILGGLDVDYLCRATPEQITERAKALLEKTATRGSYALGSGNSIPYYVPKENYYAMISAVKQGDRHRV